MAAVSPESRQMEGSDREWLGVAPGTNGFAFDEPRLHPPLRTLQAVVPPRSADGHTAPRAPKAGDVPAPAELPPAYSRAPSTAPTERPRARSNSSAPSEDPPTPTRDSSDGGGEQRRMNRLLSLGTARLSGERLFDEERTSKESMRGRSLRFMSVGAKAKPAEGPHTSASEALQREAELDLQRRKQENLKKKHQSSAAIDLSDSKQQQFFDWDTKLINSKSTFATAWDVQTTVLLVMTAMMTPYEVTFAPDEVELNGAFFLNIAIDLCFFVDMIFQFFIPFPDPSSGQMVSYHPLIRKRYLRGWFAIDLVSILPFNVISYIFNSKEVSKLKVLRAIRLLRLAKLLRVLRGLRMFKRWEARLAVNYAMMNLSFLCLVLVFGCHWLACGYGFLVEMDPNANWKKAFPLTYDEASSWDRFSAAIYWSVGMVTGQSDPFALNVHTTMMRTTYTIVAGIAGIANAYLIGGVVSLLERMNERKSEFYRDMDILNEFIGAKRMAEGTVLMDGRSLSGAELCEKLRSYFIFRHSHGKLAQSFRQIVEDCSKQMQHAISAKVHTRDLSSVGFFQNASQEFVTKLAHELTTHIYAARETIFNVQDRADKLYIVDKGLVFARGRIIRDHDVFGEEVLERDSGPRGYLAYTLSEAVLLWIGSKAIKRVVQESGHAMMRVRMKVIGAVNRLKTCTRRAAKVTINRMSFYDGYEVLRTEYSDAVLEVEDSPIVALLKLRVENHLAFLADLRRADQIRQLRGMSMSTALSLRNLDLESHSTRSDKSGESFQSDLKAESFKSALSRFNGRGSSLLKHMDTVNTSLNLMLMHQASEEFFSSLEKRVAKRKQEGGGVEKKRREEELDSLRTFLARTAPDLTTYAAALQSQHNVKLSALRTSQDLAIELRKTQLMMMGIPFVDAARIAQAAVGDASPHDKSRHVRESFRRWSRHTLGVPTPPDADPVARSPRPRRPSVKPSPAPEPSHPPGPPPPTPAAATSPHTPSCPPASQETRGPASPSRGRPEGRAGAEAGAEARQGAASAAGDAPAGPSAGPSAWALDPSLEGFLRNPDNFPGGQDMSGYVDLLGIQQRITFEDLLSVHPDTGLGPLVSVGVRFGDAVRILAAAQEFHQPGRSPSPAEPTISADVPKPVADAATTSDHKTSSQDTRNSKSNANAADGTATPHSEDSDLSALAKDLGSDSD